MANTASRLSANGSLTISGYFDEVSRPFSDNGLVSHWDGRRSFYIGQGTDDTWYDIKANNNIKLYYGANYTPGNVNFYYANTSYGLVTIPQVATSSFVTIEGVIKSPISGGMFFGFGAYDVYTSGSNLGYNTAQSNVYGISNAQITSLGIRDKYTHYAFVMVGLGGDIPTSNEIWINGVKQTLSNVIGTTTTNDRGFNYFGDYALVLNGWSYPGGYRDYKNDISFAKLRIYNRKLDANEIIQNYNLVAPNFGLTQISSPLVTKTTANNIIINGEFDEVTYNSSANVQVNLISHSQDFTQGSQWSALSGLSVTSPGEIAPDGTRTAQLFTGNGVTTGYLNTTFPWVIGRNYTFSCYFKTGTRSDFTILLYGIYFGTTGTGSTGCDFNLSNGVMNTFGGATATMQNVGNGWFRCSVTARAFITRPVGDIGGQVIRMSAASGTIYAWGYQIEEADSPSIYVRTGTNAIIANTFNQRTTNTGNTFIKGTYDEYSKMSPITEGLIFNVDPGYEGSYDGSASAMYDTTSNRYKVDLLGNSTPKYSSDYGGIIKFTGTFINNEYANTNFPSRTITPTTNYSMSAWVKLNKNMKSLAEWNSYIRDPVTQSVTGSSPIPTANTGGAYGSSGCIIGNSYYGDYGLSWYTYIYYNVKYLGIKFQNRVVPYAESSPYYEEVISENHPFFGWTHVVGTYDYSGNIVNLYLNGVLKYTTTAIVSGTFPYSFPTVQIASSLVFGGNSYGRNLDGDLGPMSIWNRALSTSEVQQMYNSQRSRFGV